MMSRRSSCGTSVVGGMLYCVGGNDGTMCMSSVERYNPRRNTWEPITAMNSRSVSGVLLSVSVCSQGALRVVSECLKCSQVPLMSLQCPSVSPWSVSMSHGALMSRVPPVSLMSHVPLSAPSVSVSQVSQCLMCLKCPHVSCPQCPSVSQVSLSALKCPHVCLMSLSVSVSQVPHVSQSTHEVVEIDGLLYALGGNDGSSSLNSMERYDGKQNKWVLVTSMLSRRSSVGAAVVDCLQLEKGLTKTT
ncbi:hypothetical protein O3P69_009261 [Scylla paramamosain]|uniref:Uncharacterized protein n=1 Tax=Scylla paramamosain TaxID=85552 RepID=A0AAW0TCE2_SCYPA